MNNTYSKLSYGLFIVSSKYDGKDNGCIVNTVIQVTSKPAKLAVTVSKNNLTSSLIATSKMFNIVILSKDVSMNVIGDFGFKSGNDVDKFANYTCATDVNGVKYISDNMIALFSCKVVDSLDLGSHIMFIGDVEDSKLLSDSEPMTYDYYHKVKKGLTPKNSPAYREDQANHLNEIKGYQCEVCGHIAKYDNLPDDFICPICGQPRKAFHKL